MSTLQYGRVNYHMAYIQLLGTSKEMKKILYTSALILTASFCLAQQTEVTIIGNIHQPVPNYNANTLYNILTKIHPDFLLQELDSSFFDSDFQFKENPTENEGIASARYIAQYPATKMRPFDFEGRNEYRKEIGSRPTDGLTIDLLDSLYNQNLLSKRQSEIYKTYEGLLEPLMVAASKSLEHFNNSKTDSICAQRQYYQYTMLPKIINVREEFSNQFHTKPNGEKISYQEGFQLACNFWDLRNQTMAKNILKIANNNKGKRIVVLIGFMHRYYIISELKRLISHNRNIKLKEFYEY